MPALCYTAESLCSYFTAPTTLYAYHTHFIDDNTEACSYKVTCLMHRSGKLGRWAKNPGPLACEFWGTRMFLLDSGSSPAHIVSAQEIFVE